MCAVQRSNRHAVCDHRCHRKLISEAKLRKVCIFHIVEVRHDRGGPGIIEVERVDLVGRAAVVIAAVAKAEGMTDFMDVGLIGMGVQPCSIILKPQRRDVDERIATQPV